MEGHHIPSTQNKETPQTLVDFWFNHHYISQSQVTMDYTIEERAWLTGIEYEHTTLCSIIVPDPLHDVMIVCILIFTSSGLHHKVWSENNVYLLGHTKNKKILLLSVCIYH